MMFDAMPSRKPKIGIVFYGIPRSGRIAFPAINDKIIAPASALGDVVVRYHFYRQNRVVSATSGENGDILPADYEAFRGFSGQLSDPEVIYKSFDVDGILASGDAWADGGVSTCNLLKQLFSLECVTKQILECEPDLVIFARPDLIYHDCFTRLIMASLKNYRLPVASIPSWQWSMGGYNDRFALCTGRAIAAYGFRGSMIAPYLAEMNKPLHSERLLRYALDRALIFVRHFPASASRVRVDGRVVRERFEPVNGSRLVKYWIREACKSVLSGL
jgi:hypothetical protein